MLAIIPARGGSKGLPGKNIKELGGKPLIAHTIDAALGSKQIDKVVVSTDDNEIAAIARQFGAEVPFMRPSELATDDAKAIDNYIYTIERLEAENVVIAHEFIVLQPTSPLRTSLDIDNAIELYRAKNADTVISYFKASHPPTWAKRINDNNVISDYFAQGDDILNRQEIEQAYMPNGALYILKFEALKSNYSYYNERTFAYIMDAERSIDIDTQLDFDLAEFYLNRGHSSLSFTQ